MNKCVFRVISLSLVLVFFLCESSLAQINFGGTVSVGASTVSNHEGSMFRPGAFNLGAFGSYAVADNVNVLAELSLATRGDKYDLMSTTGVPPFQFDVEYTGRLAMNYLQLALLAMFMNEMIQAGGGVYFGSLLSAKDKGTGTVNGMTEDYDEDWKDDAESIDVGVQLEALYRITDMISAGIVGQIGLTRVYEPYMTDDPKNSFFGLKARIRLTDN